jgi:protocatechuate 3,4-dioxygenase beta subunit
MDSDDVGVGSILNRREAVRLLAAAGITAFAGTRLSRWTGEGTRSTPVDARLSCVVRPELTEGPYFLDKQLDRSDIRAEPSTGLLRAGLPLALTVNVSQLANNACSPVVGAIVDVWQCDAEGIYSGVNDPLFGNRPAGEKFLRGYQRTDASGAAKFTTIYPGWYQGRTVHIHFKIRTSTPGGQSYEFTSQFFFDDALTDRVFAQSPYAAKGKRDTRNAQDGIYRGGGAALVLAPTSAQTGYASAFDVALDLNDARAAAPDGMRGGGRRGGPPPGGRRGGPPPGL